MTLRFIHFSDIHFEDKSQNPRFENSKHIFNQIKIDLKSQCLERKYDHVDGIIVSGDIAYSGKTEEYESADNFLLEVCKIVNCHRSSVLLVPGNHDIYRANSTPLVDLAIEKLSKIAGGEFLESILSNKFDKERIYARLNNFYNFADKYGGSLDHPSHSDAGRLFQLRPNSNRFIRIFGVNSALISHRHEEKTTLLLADNTLKNVYARQNEEIVLISHHPLDWLQNHKKIEDRISDKVRLFISGHEHAVSATVKNKNRIMFLTAGAVLPSRLRSYYKPDDPMSSDIRKAIELGQKRYYYNIIEIDDLENSKLEVNVIPRCLNENSEGFITERLDFEFPYKLDALNWQKSDTSSSALGNRASENEVALHKDYAKISYIFFNNLSPKQRGKMLKDLKRTLRINFDADSREDYSKLFRSFRSYDAVKEMKSSLEKINIFDQAADFAIK